MLMVSVDEVMQILKEYLVCDGLYREVDDIEIRCRLNQASIEIPTPIPTRTFTEEEWYE